MVAFHKHGRYGNEAKSLKGGEPRYNPESSLGQVELHELRPFEGNARILLASLSDPWPIHQIYPIIGQLISLMNITIDICLFSLSLSVFLSSVFLSVILIIADDISISVCPSPAIFIHTLNFSLCQSL